MLEVNNFFHGTRIVEGYGVLNETGNEVKALGFVVFILFTIIKTIIVKNMAKSADKIKPKLFCDSSEAFDSSKIKRAGINI